MADPIAPKQSPEPYDPSPRLTPPRSGGGTGQIVLGLVMLIGGIVLSMAGTGRVFIGLVAVGVITLVKGLANAAR